MPEHRPVFRPPFDFEEHPESFVVVDADKNPLCYIYYSEDKARRHAMRRLTKDEARRMAVQVARLPDLLKIEKIAKAEAAGASFGDCGNGFLNAGNPGSEEEQT